MHLAEELPQITPVDNCKLKMNHPAASSGVSATLVDA
jgi:hypothetical protein